MDDGPMDRTTLTAEPYANASAMKEPGMASRMQSTAVDGSTSKGHHVRRLHRGKGKFPRYKGSSLNIQKLHNKGRIPSNGTSQSDPKPLVDADGDLDQSPRRQQRRRDRSKWKPYHLLTFDERRTRDEQETKRAEEKRNRRTALGFAPSAPYNTTQFLMNDHKTEHDTSFEEPAYTSSEESNAGFDDDLDRGYDEEWQRVLVANLSLLPKDRLVDYALKTELEKNELERKLKRLEAELARHCNGGSCSDACVDDNTIVPRSFRAESV